MDRERETLSVKFCHGTFLISLINSRRERTGERREESRGEERRGEMRGEGMRDEMRGLLYIYC